MSIHCRQCKSFKLLILATGYLQNISFFAYRDLENDKAVENILSSKGKQQHELISNLLESEKYQREAFSSLFMKQDTKNKEISQQVEQIQSELAALSMVEMTKKGLKVEYENEAMRGKRETLTTMLVELMDQKKQRQEELNNRLQEMEQFKSEEQENYWLIQYQKLLDSKPKGLQDMESRIDPNLKDILTKAGAEDYIPVFATRNLTLKQVSYLKDRDLTEVGSSRGGICGASHFLFPFFLFSLDYITHI